MNPPQQRRLSAYLYKLQGMACESCNKIYFPSSIRKCNCGSSRFRNFIPSGKGKILIFTKVYKSNKKPYHIGLVQLIEGPTISLLLCDVIESKLVAGASVNLVIRKLKDDSEEQPIIYGIKARPTFQ